MCKELAVLNEFPQVLLFDGLCNLCNSSVQLVLKANKSKSVQFAAIQSTVGVQILEYFNIDPSKTDSLIFIDKQKAYVKMTAVLHLSKYLKFPYSWLQVLFVIPEIIRNAVYDYIAKNRYLWFGKKDTCMIPSSETAKRFLG